MTLFNCTNNRITENFNSGSWSYWSCPGVTELQNIYQQRSLWTLWTCYMVGGKTKPYPYMKITWKNTKVGTGCEGVIDICIGFLISSLSGIEDII